MNDYPYCKSSVLQILKQPLSDTDYLKLEEDLVENGCRDSLLVWDKYVIDGANRYDICKAYGLTYTTKHKNFREMIDAISYICEVQLKREDLTIEMRKYLIGRKYLADVEIWRPGICPKSSGRISEIASYASQETKQEI